MLKKISRKAFLNTYPNFPTTDYRKDIYTFPNYHKQYILYVEAKSTRGLCNIVSQELAKLTTLLDYENISFLGDNTAPWLFREHDYKPVTTALNYLAENKISKSFNGAILTNAHNQTEFTKHLFWLVRCNGVVFYPYFSDVNFNIVGTICQYGNIHLSTLNQKSDQLLNNMIQKTKFIITDKSKCTGRIYGRIGNIQS
jgi:hypothetical protein